MEKTGDGSQRPQWAPRVSRYKIAQLYRTDAQGILDEELIDEVGYAFLARSESILQATEAARGAPLCPECGDPVPYSGDTEEDLSCKCGWRLPWSEYRKSYRRKQLSAGGIEPFLREFVEKFPRAKTHRHKMILIDILIHRYHWELEGDPGRPGAANLIGGKISEIVEFLYDLSYSDQSTPGLHQTYNRWRKRGRRLIRKLEKARGLRQVKKD